ncbi:MAG: hypothetical protein Q6K14_03930 [Gloeomargarita sp. GMQP_bins_44]
MGSCQSRPVEISQSVQRLTLRGRAGGPVESGVCGYLARHPHHQLHLPQAMDYLKIQVNSPSPVTVFVQGPDGAFCATPIGDRPPQISGYWPAGMYRVFVGTPTHESSPPYELVIQGPSP